MRVEMNEMSPGEQAVAKTLLGWCAELDTGRRFWWNDWWSIIGDVVTAMRTGEPVLHDDDDEEPLNDAISVR